MKSLLIAALLFGSSLSHASDLNPFRDLKDQQASYSLEHGSSHCPATIKVSVYGNAFGEMFISEFKMSGNARGGFINSNGFTEPAGSLGGYSYLHSTMGRVSCGYTNYKCPSPETVVRHHVYSEIQFSPNLDKLDVEYQTSDVHDGNGYFAEDVVLHKVDKFKCRYDQTSKRKLTREEIGF